MKLADLPMHCLAVLYYASLLWGSACRLATPLKRPKFLRQCSLLDLSQGRSSPGIGWTESYDDVRWTNTGHSSLSTCSTAALLRRTTGDPSSPPGRRPDLPVTSQKVFVSIKLEASRPPRTMYCGCVRTVQHTSRERCKDSSHLTDLFRHGCILIQTRGAVGSTREPYPLPGHWNQRKISGRPELDNQSNAVLWANIKGIKTALNELFLRLSSLKLDHSRS